VTGFPETRGRTTAPPLVLLHGGNVANWMWEPQVPAFGDRLVITPDLPGFGERAHEVWPGLDAVADAVVDRLAEHGVDGPVDLAGLSLGALTALRVLARHPDRVRSAFITSAPLTPAGPGLRAFCAVHETLSRFRWYWRAQAAAFRLPADSRERYVAHGASVRPETTRAVNAEVCAGGTPTGLDRYTGPLLAVAGERDPAAVRSLPALTAAAPQTRARIARGMHHIWNIEDVDLFNDTLRAWLGGEVDPRLAAASQSY
jgi:pimeloyl-ACP methyl ester carboxylesterase